MIKLVISMTANTRSPNRCAARYAGTARRVDECQRPAHGTFVDLVPAEFEQAIAISAVGGFLVAQLAARRRCSKEADHSAFASGLGPAEADCQEPIEHGVDLVGDLDRAEMSSEHRLCHDQLGAELLQAVEIARHVHQRHIRGDIGHGNLASLRRGRRIIVLREILDGRIGRLLRYLLARRQNIGLVDHLSPRRIVEIATDLPCVGFRYRSVVRPADAVQQPLQVWGILQTGGRHHNRVDHHHARGEFRITPAQFKHDRAAEAVADHDGLLQSQLGPLPGDIVRDPRYGVFLLRRVAGAMAAKINGHHATGLPEMSDLGREDTMVTGPAIDENQRRALRSLGRRLKMRETHTAAIQENWLERFIRDHGLSPELTLYSCESVKRLAGPTTPTYDAIASRQKESITTAIDNAE